jgi:protein-tyrosine phosphatase
MTKPKILFVCGRNKRRSPTAEKIYRNEPRIEVRSAGTSEKSPHPISSSDLIWADLVLVMENKYKGKISSLFRDIYLPPIKSLDIPDDYQYMDEELIELIKSSVEPQIKLFSNEQL